MRRSDFHYDLPPELIAQTPLPQRSDSRLLELDAHSGQSRDLRFRDLPGVLRAGDLLVCNDTRVLPARLRGRKRSGGGVELLLERLVDVRNAWVQIRANRGLRIGAELDFPGGVSVRVEGRRGMLYEVSFSQDVRACFETYGETPLPPYIARAPLPEDRGRYQTVFARETGAIAAPTAGLHFDQSLLDALDAAGVERDFITLHVGLGTFEPVRSEDVEAHTLHRERVVVSPALCEHVRATQARGGRVVTVGTTVVRALESAALGGALEPLTGETDLFIRPGFRFRVVDALITNFHLPESSLLMLVAAFAGLDATLAAYRHAVDARYRFFSYGDAMLVTAAAHARQLL
jgi:S-adenosylmethionine:tRNA ribosyltransferase-isomerase